MTKPIDDLPPRKPNYVESLIDDKIAESLMRMALEIQCPDPDIKQLFTREADRLAPQISPLNPQPSPREWHGIVSDNGNFTSFPSLKNIVDPRRFGFVTVREVLE
jgi:hypothetical protein